MGAGGAISTEREEGSERRRVGDTRRDGVEGEWMWVEVWAGSR